ncbi:type IV pilin protein [Campylobacter magnus]|uniref:type IV pilin protein n=1 Tax=Campylobacter magnus TaxID=3026462 RepID=UPI002360865A|nr:prepilin-type N-terminal cleavage/methylation domain-containing protein [Campylobacter magnus]MDD0855244.1 prepilin-type N-terminal cleavage/methylation domain-containing protein [Campylobacter magnus]
MKKGFTMIELIFVIVILGILASVAIPRLASTRTDAEISAAVANIRTLIGDLSSYYAVKGSFTDAKWGDITNVPIHFSRNRPVSNTKVTEGDDDGAVYLSAGGTDCIVIRVRANTTPVCIEIAKVRNNVGKGICPEIIEAEPIKAFLDAKVPGVTPLERDGAGIIALGSSISIYQEATTTTPPTTTP